MREVFKCLWSLPRVLSDTFLAWVSTEGLGDEGRVRSYGSGDFPRVSSSGLQV